MEKVEAPMVGSSEGLRGIRGTVLGVLWGDD